MIIKEIYVRNTKATKNTKKPFRDFRSFRILYINILYHILETGGIFDKDQAVDYYIIYSATARRPAQP